MEVKRRHDLKAKEIKKLEAEVKNFGEEFVQLLKGRIEVCLTDLEFDLILVNGEPRFFRKDRVFPTLKALVDRDVRKMKNQVTVDMGAVFHIANGADVMRPGIVSLDNKIKKGDFVVVTEEIHGKPLAIGIALFDANEILKMNSGKVVKTIHYVGDKMWDVKL